MSRRRVSLEGENDVPPPTISSTKQHPSTNQKRNSILKTPATPLPVQSPPYSPLSTNNNTNWEREYRILREAYRRQERRLDKLQEENDALWQELNALKQNEDTSPTTPKKESSTTAAETLHSPGAQFVAELVEVMDLSDNVGHLALLSSIVDRQRNEEKQKERRRCSM